MGIGLGVLLLAAGAVLTFAVEVDSTEGFNLNTLGIILMIAGAISLLMTALVFGPRRRAVVGGDGTVVETHRRDVY